MLCIVFICSKDLCFNHKMLLINYLCLFNSEIILVIIY